MSGQSKALLVLDAGNSRLKWMHSSASGVLRGAIPNAELSAQALLKALEPGSLDELVVSSVRSDKFNAELQLMCEALWGVDAVFARVQRECLGVKAAYDDLAYLGVDRWLAMLAAYNRSKRACVVVDAGTAITVDFVDAAGMHLGGLIVPGLQAVLRGLWHGTDAVSPESLTIAQNWQPGCDTVSCVEQGVSASMRGLVEQVKHYSQRLSPVDFYLTGGDSSVFEPWVEGAILAADLVMDGAMLWIERQ